MPRVDGSNLVMRDAGVLVRTHLRASEPRLRRRPIGQALEQPGSESAARQAPDITHLIGFGILLSAALLIAIGSFCLPPPSGHSEPAPPATTKPPPPHSPNPPRPSARG